MPLPLARHRLADLGVRLSHEDIPPDVRSECLRLAHRLHARAVARIGLFPSGDRVSAIGVGLQLADALADATGAAVAVVDANGVWPAFPEVAREGEGDFVTQWLRDSMALITARHAAHAGDVLPRLGGWLAHEAASFAHVVFDLTGFDRLGEHRAAAQLVDECFVVARAGVTSEAELAAWQRDLPGDRFGGVILVGGG